MIDSKEVAGSNGQSSPGRPHDVDGARELAGRIADGVGQGGLSNASLTLLATAIGQIGEGIVITDVSATIQYVNPAFTKMTGYSAKEVIGQNARLLKSGRENAAYYRELWKTILAGKVWQGEIVNRRKDGTLYTAEMSITPVRDPSGAIANFIAIKQDVTERRATEAALHSSTRKLEDIQHIAPLGSWELDIPANAVRGSDVFCRIFDWAPDTAVLPFSKMMDAIASADRERVDKTIKNTLQNREPFDVEHRVVHRNGMIRVVRNRGQVVAEQGGAPVRLVGTVYDITRSRLAHQKLRQSEERFRSLVANIPDVTWTARADGRTDYISPNIARVLGFTSEEMCGQPGEFWFARIEPGDGPRIMDAFRQLFAEGQPFDVEYREQRKDGQWIWAHDRAYRTYERDGVRYADGVFSDITQRKRAEEVLRESERFQERERAEEKVRESNELVRLVLDSVPEAVYGIDLRGNCLFCNPACLRLLGYRDAAELHGKNMHAVMHHTRQDGMPYPVKECHIYEAFRRGHGTHKDDEILWRSDGTHFPAEYWSHPMYRRGNVVSTVVTFVDITERKRVEQVLREAKEAAEAANRAKSQFLANMSHEIRTPMNGVIGVSGLLLDSELTAEQRQYAGIVRSSGEALLKVINDILDFSKIEARKLTLEKTDFDLRAVLEDAVAVLAFKASEKGLALTSEIEPGTPTQLRGDPFRVRQVLVNLLGNGVKFTSQGKVAVRVQLEEARLEAAETGTATLRFTVSDTGIGFQQNHASTLFEPFVQADGSSTRRYGGTGLGLTIAKQLVELMGGQIGVESQEGKGSTFWFTGVFEKQPRVLIAATEKAYTPCATSPLPQPPPAAAKHSRILLAEDNLTNQAVAKAMLSKLGHDADVVANGAEALQALREADYDLVLMDCGMPGMDGYAATRCIRAGQSGSHNSYIPIVALTADAMSGDRDRCLAAGMNDYLAKPVDLRSLARALEKWRNAPSGRGELSARTETVLNQTVFHEEELVARLMGDKHLASKIIGGFLDDAPRQLCILKKMLGEGDADGARRQAHTLKGAASTISAGALRSLCSKAQEAAAAHDLLRSMSLLPQLEEQFELLKAALKKSGLWKQVSGGSLPCAH